VTEEENLVGGIGVLREEESVRKRDVVDDDGLMKVLDKNAEHRHYRAMDEQDSQFVYLAETLHTGFSALTKEYKKVS
jgi:hypothetical protein